MVVEFGLGIIRRNAVNWARTFAGPAPTFDTVTACFFHLDGMTIIFTLQSRSDVFALPEPRIIADGVLDRERCNLLL